MLLPALAAPEYSMLRQRLGRFATASRLAFAERGLFAGSRFVARTVRRKFVQLFKNQVAAKEAGALRVELAALRCNSHPDTAHLAVAATGGIGDLIVIARFMRDIAEATQAISFHVFVPRPETAAWVFQNVTGFAGAYPDSLFEQVRDEYDMAIRANSFVITYTEHLRWGHLCKTPRMAEIAFSIIRGRAEVDPYVEQHPYLDNRLARDIVHEGWTRRDYMHHLAGIEYGGDRMALPRARGALERFGLAAGAYVTIHNGFDTDFVVTGKRATKCYPFFSEVVMLMRRARPDLMFVQLGTITSEVIAPCDVNLINRTSMPEAAALIACAAMHIDNEGGLVHLAACLGTPSTVVFGPTPSAYFGYAHNVNIDPNFCGDCWWKTRSWMDRCAEGFSEPRCLTEQKPEYIAQRALAALGRAPAMREDRRVAEPFPAAD
jgi:hypothetical protein